MTDRNAAAPVVRFTTAPEAYDGFGTRTMVADAGRDNRGLVIRKVAIRPEHIHWQFDRYASGLHGCCSPEDAARFPSIWQLNG